MADQLPDPPPHGGFIEIAPRIWWARLPLPMRLNHVNVYLFEDDDGWTIFDAGVADGASRDAWESILSGLVRDRPIRRVIVSHFHTDHVGLAGWLCDRFDAEFLMSQTEYLLARVFQQNYSVESVRRQVRFFHGGGLPLAAAEGIARSRLGNLGYHEPMPPQFERLAAGQFITLAGRRWTVLTGGGHAVEQVMLHCKEDGIFLAADQVMAEISPNISVGTLQPGGNPLRDFFISLDQIKAEIPAGVMVLSGHRRAFFGLHRRIDELKSHHQGRCDAILAAIDGKELTVLDLVPIVFGRSFEGDIVASAMGEALAHANYLAYDGRLDKFADAAGHVRFAAAARR
jgi:glyoxylase-like metal-dependent hydrolase (beta-lactamase superfamily II)